MSRLHLHIAVNDLDESTQFYTALFGRTPDIEKADYAKWELTDPAVNFAISARGADTGIDHVGLQAGSDDELQSIRARLEAAGIDGREQANAACCYARSDKYWLTDPQGVAWETFHTLESIPTFNNPESAEAARGCCTPAGAGCC